MNILWLNTLWKVAQNTTCSLVAIYEIAWFLLSLRILFFLRAGTIPGNRLEMFLISLFFSYCLKQTSGTVAWSVPIFLLQNRALPEKILTEWNVITDTLNLVIFHTKWHCPQVLSYYGRAWNIFVQDKSSSGNTLVIAQKHKHNPLWWWYSYRSCIEEN